MKNNHKADSISSMQKSPRIVTADGTLDIASLGLLLRIIDEESGKHKNCCVQSIDGRIVTYPEARNRLALLLGSLIAIV